MIRALAGLGVWLAALWWGGLTAVVFGAVPLLFAHLPSPALAGNMAAHLFSALTWLALVCGLVLLMLSRVDPQKTSPALANQAKSALVFVLAGMLAAALAEFAVAPRIVARQNLPLWHGLGVGLYLLQWLCATLTLKKWLSCPADAS